MNQDTAAQTEASPAAGAAPPRRSRVMRLRTSRPVVFVIHGTPLGWPLRWLWSLARADDTRARLGDLDEWKEELSTKTMAKVVRRVDDFEAVELRLLAVEEALVALSQRANALEAELRSLSGGSPGIGSPETGGLAVEAASGREAPLLDVPLVWASDVNETAGVAAPPASRLSNPGPTGRRRSRPAPFSAPSTRCEAYARYVAPGRHPAAFLDLGSGTDDLRRALLDRGIPVATPRDRAGPGAIDLNVPVGTLSEAEAIAFLRSSGAPASGVLLSQFGGYLTPGNLAQFVTAAHARLASGESRSWRRRTRGRPARRRRVPCSATPPSPRTSCSAACGRRGSVSCGGSSPLQRHPAPPSPRIRPPGI